jgi:hypothetical protein
VANRIMEMSDDEELEGGCPSGAVDDETVSSVSWFRSLAPDQRKRAREMFAMRAPVSEIEADRATFATGSASSISQGNSGQGYEDKSWFKKRMKESVYPCYKFLCLKDKKYGEIFCVDVFAAIGREKREEDWDCLYRRSEAAINEIRAGDGSRIKEAFEGIFCWYILLVSVGFELCC